MNRTPITAPPCDRNSWNEWWTSSKDLYHRYHPGALHRERLVMNLLKRLSFESLLDVGCGQGQLLQSLRKNLGHRASFFGVDYSESAVAYNKRLYPQSEFYLLDIEKATLDRRFDVVLCCEVLEHLHDSRNAFKNLASMVNDGGYLLVTTPSGPIFQTEKFFGHLRHFEKKILIDWAREEGLTTSEVHAWGFPTFIATKYLINVRADLALKSFWVARHARWKEMVSLALYYLNFLNLNDHARGCQLVGLFRKDKAA